MAGREVADRAAGRGSRSSISLCPVGAPASGGTISRRSAGRWGRMSCCSRRPRPISAGTTGGWRSCCRVGIGWRLTALRHVLKKAGIRPGSSSRGIPPGPHAATAGNCSRPSIGMSPPTAGLGRVPCIFVLIPRVGRFLTAERALQACQSGQVRGVRRGPRPVGCVQRPRPIHPGDPPQRLPPKRPGPRPPGRPPRRYALATAGPSSAPLQVLARWC